MASPADISNNTKALKDMLRATQENTRQLKELIRLGTAINNNLVEIGRMMKENTDDGTT